MYTTAGLDNVVYSSGGLNNAVYTTGGLDNAVYTTGGLNNAVYTTGGLDNAVYTTGGLANAVYTTGGGLTSAPLHSGYTTGLDQGAVLGGGLTTDYGLTSGAVYTTANAPIYSGLSAAPGAGQMVIYEEASPTALPMAPAAGPLAVVPPAPLMAPEPPLVSVQQVVPPPARSRSVGAMPRRPLTERQRMAQMEKLGRRNEVVDSFANLQHQKDALAQRRRMAAMRRASMGGRRGRR
eukprot:NODE_1437_length_861_cov_71.392371_g1390_i0.p1 GENE.NODE_1437_length_861_cov_71.392371_g1390_i0~~NODE_1437_length_861_cov_71.392371_g1390_i0.p1  ORF type:complete len:263 (+),score=73.61 NODE_1437_length_861_cov_71.392371_g1390_i0:82-789(+)